MALGTLKDKVIDVIYTATAMVGTQGLLCLGGKWSDRKGMEGVIENL